MNERPHRELKSRTVTSAYAWEPVGDPGFEHLVLALGEDGFEAEGIVVRLLPSGPIRLGYRVAGDRAWRVTRLEAELAGAGRRRIALTADGEGRWYTRRGCEVGALSGCIDLDIAATPFTNTLPIRRRPLAVGEVLEITVAYLRVPELDVAPVPQRYTRIGRRDRAVYRYENLASGFAADLPTDADGIVVDYPGQWRRLWPVGTTSRSGEGPGSPID